MWFEQIFPAPDASPAAWVSAWAFAIALGLVGWLILSVIFYPIYRGLRQLVAPVGQNLEHAFQAARDWSFGLPTRLQNEFQGLACAEDLTTVTRETGVFLQRGGVGGGVRRVINQLRGEVDRLGAIEQVDWKVIEVEKRGRLSSLLMALFFTALALCVLTVNTFLLNLFFESIFEQRFAIFGLSFSLGLLFSLMYTLVEFGLGLGLEQASEKAEQQRGEGKSAAAMIFVQMICVLLIFCAVLIECVLYGMLSFEIDWPWPEELSVPAWMDGWLAIMGLLIGSLVALLGFWTTQQWKDVWRGFSAASLAKQARVMETVMPQLPARVRQLNEALDAAKAVQAAETGTGSSGSRVGVTVGPADVQRAGEAQARTYRYSTQIAALAGVSVLPATVFLMFEALVDSALAGDNTWIALGLAIGLSIVLIFAGRIAGPTFTGHEIAAGRVDPNATPVVRVQEASSPLIRLVALIGGIIIASVPVVQKVVSGSPIEWQSLGATIALCAGCFGVGIFGSQLVQGIAFWLRAVVAAVIGLIVLVWALVLYLIKMAGGAVWLVVTLLGAPANWMLGGKRDQSPIQGKSNAR